MKFEIVEFNDAGGLPDPWGRFEQAATLLKHSGGDVIIWNDAGEKIKSEWD